MLWDLRMIDRPLKQIQSGKNHLQLCWCATRSSLLTSIQRESPYMTLYDVRSVDVENSRDVFAVKKQLLPFHTKYHGSHKAYALTALSWHHTDFERALLLSETGTIQDFRLPVSILTAYNNQKKLPLLMHRPLSSSTTTMTVASSNDQNTSTMASSFAGTVGMTSENNNGTVTGTVPVANGPAINLHVIDHNLLEEDLVDETRERALADYGLKMDGKRLSAESHLSAYLKNVWLSLVNLYRPEEKLTGLKTVLGIGLGHTSEAFMNTASIESHVLQWPDFINNSNNLVCYRYVWLSHSILMFVVMV